MQPVFTSKQAAEDYRQAHQLHGRVAEPLAGSDRWALVFPLACHVEVRDGVPAEIRAAMNAEPGAPASDGADGEGADEPGTPASDARRAAINRRRAEQDRGAPVRRLLCCCCGMSTRGRQWHDRDTGYGVCMPCIDWAKARGNTSPDELLNYYGAEGIHYGAAL